MNVLGLISQLIIIKTLRLTLDVLVQVKGCVMHAILALVSTS
jgi:hypothetical protein